MKTVELIFDGDCPNVEPARDSIRKALAEVGHPARWQEWDRADPQSPPYVQGYGSPTVLVDGLDIAGQEAGAKKSCRVYTDSSGRLTGVPPVELITAALCGESVRASPTGESAHDCCPPAAADAADRSTAVLKGRAGLLATSGSVLSAIASSACCWLPLLLIGFGASAVGVGAFFEKYRILLLASAALLLAGGFYYNYFRKETCEPGSACETPSPRLRSFSRAMLWFGTALVLAFALFPNYVGALIGVRPRVIAAATGEPRVIELAIEGMTCAGCEAHVEKSLLTVPGVLDAEAEYGQGAALVHLDPDVTTPTDELIGAIRKAGYDATLKEAIEEEPGEAL